MFVERIKALVAAYDSGEEFASLQYPDFKEAFSEFLECHGVRSDDFEISEVSEALSIDVDGYPIVNGVISISSNSLTVPVVACHHSKWDFYFKGDM